MWWHMYDGHMHDAWSQGIFGGEWLMFFGMILVPVLLVLLVVWLMRQQRATTTGTSHQSFPAAPPTPPYGESPREILQRRYARGEIDREVYLQRLSDLE